MSVIARPRVETTVRRRVERLFSPRPVHAVPRLGVEIELFGLRTSDDALQPASMLDVQPVVTDRRIAGFTAHQAALTFEPGAQLEFSSEPRPGAVELALAADRFVDAAQAAASAAHLAFVAMGTDPLHGRRTWPLAVDSHRYRVMQDHFDALGPRGRTMMRQTAALQLGVEVSPGSLIDTWLVLNRAGPALTAMFANSPVLEGWRTGEASSRLSIWLEADRSRTGFDAMHVHADDPVEAYVDFAMSALAMALPRDGRTSPAPATTTLRTWIDSDDGVDDADIDHHLSTLFPPVRPRGDYLEVRYLDALPMRWAAHAIVVIATLAHGSRARLRALEAVDDTSMLLQRWESAARYGIRDRSIAAEACELLDIVVDELRSGGVPGVGSDSVAPLLEFRERFLESGRSPGDDLDDLLRLEPERLVTWI
ncbi:MAG: glutamate-cysteine ligase family protein [Candidatus Dormibacteria bacterium]